MDVIIVSLQGTVTRINNVDEMYIEWLLFNMREYRRLVQDLGDVVIIQVIY